LRLKCKNLIEENRRLRQASVDIQAQAEQEEEYISNTLLKEDPFSQEGEGGAGHEL